MTPLGPRHIGALKGIRDAEYTGIGNCPTFRGHGGPSIPWRLMSGLYERGLVSVRQKEIMQLTGDVVWRAVLTPEGRTALGELE